MKDCKVWGTAIMVSLILSVVVSAKTKEIHDPHKFPKLHTVTIKQLKFSPSELHVSKGDSVLFINNDLFDHDVTEVTNGAWSSSVLKPGESWTLTVNKSADYHCSLHVIMKGKIIVE